MMSVTPVTQLLVENLLRAQTHAHTKQAATCDFPFYEETKSFCYVE